MNARVSACLAVLFFLLMPAVAGDWSAGREAYEKGDYAGAAKLFGDDAQVSAGSLHNLGNAEFKTGKIGKAVLAWERARALNPRFRNSAANLHFARGQAGLDEPALAWHEQYSLWLAPDAWLWIATVAFWGGIGLLIVPALLKRKVAWAQGVAVVAIAVFLLALPALVGIASRAKLGVVLAANTDLRLTPTAEAEVLGKLPEGDTARMEKARGEYVYVRAGNDRAGWVKAAEFSKIWP